MQYSKILNITMVNVLVLKTCFSSFLTTQGSFTQQVRFTHSWLFPLIHWLMEFICYSSASLLCFLHFMRFHAPLPKFPLGINKVFLILIHMPLMQQWELLGVICLVQGHITTWQARAGLKPATSVTSQVPHHTYAILFSWC